MPTMPLRTAPSMIDCLPWADGALGAVGLLENDLCHWLFL
jgi:hypothetical protein